MVKGVPVDVVDHTLEYHWCITESEWHDCVFESAMWATKCSFPFVSILDSDEVVALLEGDLVEVFHASNSFLQLVHVGEGITIGNHNFVDCSIVNA